MRVLRVHLLTLLTGSLSRRAIPIYVIKATSLKKRAFYLRCSSLWLFSSRFLSLFFIETGIGYRSSSFSIKDGLVSEPEK